MSLVGLLTATEKQVHLGSAPYQTDRVAFEKQFSLSESLGKVIPLPRSLHPHLRWWLQEENALQG